MATITQRIALTGDQEIKSAFDALGAAGVAAFKQIQNAANAAQSLKALAPTLNDLKTRVEAIGDAGRNFGENFGNLSDSLLSSAKSIGAIGAAVTGAITGFALLVKGAANAAEEIENVAQASGTTADKLQGLQFAAAQSGLDGDKLNTVLRGLNRSMEEAQTASLKNQQAVSNLNKEYLNGKVTADAYLQKQLDLTDNASQQITAFQRLSIATHNADGSLRDNVDVLKDIADAFQALPDGADKSGLAMQFFGRAGQQAVPFLNQGAAAIDNLVAAGNRVAPGLDKAQIAVGKNLSDAFDVLSLAAGRAKDSVLLAFAPDVQKVVEALTQFIADNRASWVALATDIAQKVKPVIDDVIAALQGRDSDVQNNTILQIRDSLISFASDAATAAGIIKDGLTGLLAILDTVARAFNAVFGTDISGGALALVGIVGKVTGAFTDLAAIIRTVVSGVGVLDAILVAVFGPEAALLVGLAAVGVAIGALVAQIPAVQDAFNALVDGFNGTVQNFKNLFDTIGKAWSDLWDGIESVARDVANRVVAFLKPVLDFISDIASKVGALAGGGGQTSSTPSGFAGGGVVRGPGTATSDSIPARLSVGEFVARAAAVRKYGADLFAALNSLRLPEQAVRSLMSGLDMTGFGAAMRPRYAFASGGLAVAGAGTGGGHRPFNLVIGAETFSNLLAPDAVADAMTRFAIRQQVRSAGRKPGWRK